MSEQRRKLGDILTDLGVLTPQQVEQVVEASRRRPDRPKFGRMAREMGFLNDEQILAALAVQMKMLPDIERLTMSRLLRRLRQPV